MLKKLIIKKMRVRSTRIIPTPKEIFPICISPFLMPTLPRITVKKDKIRRIIKGKS